MGKGKKQAAPVTPAPEPTPTEPAKKGSPDEAVGAAAAQRVETNPDQSSLLAAQPVTPAEDELEKQRRATLLAGGSSMMG